LAGQSSGRRGSTRLHSRLHFQSAAAAAAAAAAASSKPATGKPAGGKRAEAWPSLRSTGGASAARSPAASSAALPSPAARSRAGHRSPARPLSCPRRTSASRGRRASGPRRPACRGRMRRPEPVGPPTAGRPAGQQASRAAASLQSSSARPSWPPEASSWRPRVHRPSLRAESETPWSCELSPPIAVAGKWIQMRCGHSSEMDGRVAFARRASGAWRAKYPPAGAARRAPRGKTGEERRGEARLAWLGEREQSKPSPSSSAAGMKVRKVCRAWKSMRSRRDLLPPQPPQPPASQSSIIPAQMLADTRGRLRYCGLGAARNSHGSFQRRRSAQLGQTWLTWAR